jgi:hypothetical protein
MPDALLYVIGTWAGACLSSIATSNPVPLVRLEVPDGFREQTLRRVSVKLVEVIRASTHLQRLGKGSMLRLLRRFEASLYCLLCIDISKVSNSREAYHIPVDQVSDGDASKQAAEDS